MDDKEIKDLVGDIKTLHENFKKEHNALLSAKADGKSVTDLNAKVDALNIAIDAKQEQLDKIQTALKRSPTGNDSQKADLTEKVLRTAVRSWMSKGAANTSLSDAIMSVFEKHADLRENYIEAHPELKALSVNDDTQGGYMVNADMTGRIIKRVFETSPIRQYAAVASISTDALEGPKDFDEAAAGWVSEMGARGQTANPKLGVWRINTHEIFAQPAATQKLLDDAAWDPEAWISGKIGDKMSRVENNAFVIGDGIGKPKGFLSELTISDAANASVANDAVYIRDQKIGYIPTGVADDFAAVPTTAAPTAQSNALIDAVYALKGMYRDTAGTAWALHRTTMGRVRKLQDALGQYLWQPGIGAGQPQTLCGYPIVELNDMPVLGATNKFAIAFANWREAYQIVDRIGIRIIRDPFTAKPFILFYTTKRVGGTTLNHEAIKLVKMATT